MRKASLISFTLVFVIMLLGVITACTPQAAPSSYNTDSATSETQVAASADGAGAYVDDETCLSCHGGSYDALSETTSSYGLSNPHESIHGGNNHCDNCHAQDREITDNQCQHCHDWPHNPEG